MTVKNTFALLLWRRVLRKVENENQEKVSEQEGRDQT